MTIISWKVNRERIASTLCENRAIQNSDCKGQCYLNKQLKDIEKKKTALPETESMKFEMIHEPFSFIINPSFSISNISIFNIPVSIGMPIHQSFDVFHPPLG
jgi:hypothetical protein